MRMLLASAALYLLFGLSPAAAMCGGGGGQQASGGMCGKPATANSLSEWPDAPKAQAEPKSGMAMGGCPCCKNMAMMDGMKPADPHKGMDMK